MVASELPQEILIDIFSRLPEKSVGQCRCLSKPWRDILSSPHFVKSHLNRKTHQQNCILITQSVSLAIHSIATTKDGGVSRELELPFGCTEILASCDGLVLLVNEDGDQFLLNPVTLKLEMIPNSPLALKDGEREIINMHGFGYDSSIDDYKIVSLSYYNSSHNVNGYERDCEETFVDVYYVKRGVWKRVENSPYNHAFHEPCSGAFSNGAIHWLARTSELSHRPVLVAFDLSAEAFNETPVPDDINMEAILFGQVVVLGGCLSIIDVQSFFGMNVWMMKEYGVVESWTKLSIDTCGLHWSIRKPLCFVGDQEIVWVVDGPSLGVYNVKEGTSRDMTVDGFPTVDLDDAMTFVPSLVSPACGTNMNRDAQILLIFDEAYYASLSADALEEASAANLGRLLSNQSILVQCLADNMITVINKWQLQRELQKTISELSALIRDHNKLQAVIQRLLEMGRQSVEAHEALAKFRVDLYENLVGMYRDLLRDLGQVGEYVGPENIR